MMGEDLCIDFDLPEDYAPSEGEPYMNPRQLEYFRRKLLFWRGQLLEELRQELYELREDRVQEVDILDQGAIETSSSLKQRTRDRYRKLISKIDEAIESINKGTYGYCEETGEEIGIKRLEARPVATLSLEAQEWRECRGMQTRRVVPQMHI